MRKARRRITVGFVAALVLAPVTAAVAAAPAAAVVRPLPDDTYGLSSYYGPRCMPTRGASVWHLGQDMGAKKGTAVRAVTRGTVVKAGSAPGFGQVVVLQHSIGGTRWYSVYGHVVDGDRYVKTGQVVAEGKRIADVGSSGTSTSPHLHLEIWRDAYKGNGSTRDPLVWMKDRGASLSAGAAWSRARTVPSSCGYWTTTNVNLRTGPGTGYKVITTVGVNRKITGKPGDGSGSWRRVSYSGKVGWMHADYVSPNLTSLGTRYVTVNGLRLRSQPSTSASIVTSMNRGTAVTKIWPTSKGWTKVSVGGKQGFVFDTYLSTKRP